MTESLQHRRDRQATIADVAKRAGVSTGTVSHVVSGSRAVAPATKRRVERAVEELGYKPSSAARALTRGRTMTIGMVVPDLVNPIFARLLGGAEDVLAQQGYAVLFGSSENRLDKQRRYLQTLEERQVDGIIIDIATGTDEGLVSALAERIPLVLADRQTPSWSGDSVQGDNEYGIGLAVDHLVGLGHRRIGFINGEPTVWGAIRCRAGFERRMAEHGLQPAWMSDGMFSMRSGREQVHRLLSSGADVTAICVVNDIVAMGVLAALHEEGVAVPDELSVTGYDDIDFAEAVTPPLTTVTLPMREMGTVAARLLKQRLDRERSAAQSVLLRGQLVVRRSTAPPRQ